MIHHLQFTDAEDNDAVVIQSGSCAGALMVDGLGDGILIESPRDPMFVRTTSFGLLQGSRMRNTKTEYVSCPSCGRTLFDLQEVTGKIQVCNTLSCSVSCWCLLVIFISCELFGHNKCRPDMAWSSAP